MITSIITPEWWARRDAQLRHRLLTLLNEHVENNALQSDPRFLFIDTETLADRLGISANECLGHLQVLHLDDLIHSTVYIDDIEVYTLSQPGKAALVTRQLLVESGEQQFNFLRNGLALVISIIAFGLSIVALVRAT
jgi:predicted ArsR family transcriptional regulator